MAKSSTTYICQQCNYQSPQYLGKCPNCNSWNSLVETLISPKEQKLGSAGINLPSKPQRLSEAAHKPLKRIQTKVSELDRVLGGGIVPGSVVLLAGDPGIGKSTLLLQIASFFKTLYVSGEESVEQVRLRFDRIGKSAKDLFVFTDTDVDRVMDAATGEDYQIIVIDSIQTMVTADLTTTAGSIGQLRESAYRLQRLAKQGNTAVFLVGHVTKEGSIAGPKVLEHLVDTVLYLQGDSGKLFRILSATKNRFGPVDEIGVFEMDEFGMHEVKNPSKEFLSSRISAPGSIVAPVMEGSRPILTEVQALTSPTNFGLPTRRSSGIHPNRLQILVAILSKRAGVKLENQDVFVNIAGGLQIKEPGIDLGVCLAIASSAYDKVILKTSAAVGEVGLLGEIRSVPYEEKRLQEAKRLGFKNFITSKKVKNLREAVKSALDLKS
ncbi:MAG: DNA repair protein RadA [Candidatus Woykebacteria bacterium RBG_16_43_9]|uniref:DNA repair protein RadA n=1 Tax=Candidatus Woykebacteria bacterium RBG_16_43_9 TaxID=1802596 RepID=A0A1G1WCG9_9BACT|nr:MAG: DNA repair protein RadA [Candidatus Woykebacteria bacterium RBG_16_43_9]